MKNFFLFLCMLMIVFWHLGMAQAAPRTASTGDLGENVIYLGGSYTDFLYISRPSKIEQAIMIIQFIHYDSPEVPVDVILNQAFIGSFLAEPFGPVEAIFDVTGLLVNGENEIHFQGYHAPDHPDLDPGNYLIAQIDIDYFESETSTPIAEAGPDRIVFSEVFLDGSGSSDSDGAIISYEWELEHRVYSAYSRSAGGQSPTATIVDLEPGFYDVTLTVTDDDPEALTDTDTMVLAVAGGNDASGFYTQSEVDQMVAEAVAEVEAAKEAVIAGHTQTIDERNAAIVELNQTNAELSGVIAEKEALIAGHTQTIDERNAAIVELNQTNAELSGVIAEKEALIAGHTQTIDERNATIVELNQTNAELSGVIAEKEAVIAGHIQTIDERNAAIIELNQTNAELSGVIAEKEAVIAGHIQTIDERNAAIVELNQTNAELSGVIAEKEAVIAGHIQTIDERNAAIVELNQTNAELSGVIAEKEALIAGHTQTIDELNAATVELSANIAALTGTIAEKAAETAGLNQTIDELKASIVEHKHSIADLITSLAKKDQAISNLTAITAERDKIIDSLNATIDTMYTKEELDQAIEDALAGKSGKHKKSKDHKKNHKKSKDYEKKHGKSDDHEKKHGKSDDHEKKHSKY